MHTAARRGTTVAGPTAGTPRQMTLAGRVAWWSLLAMVFFIPIAMTNLTFLGFKVSFTYDQIDLPKLVLMRILTLVALGAWTWDTFAGARGRVRHTPVDWLLFAFLVWTGLTVLTSIHPPTAFFGKYRRYEGLLTFVNYAAVYFLVLQYADRAARVRMIARSLFFSTAIVSCYAVTQPLGFDLIDWGPIDAGYGRAFATFGNPDYLGGFLVFALPVVLALALGEKDAGWRVAYWAGFATALAALVVTFTRGAWIGGVVGLALMVVIAVRHSARLKSGDWIAAGVAAGIGAIYVAQRLTDSGNSGEVAGALSSRFQANAVGVGARLDIWKSALTAIKARPVLGFGPDTFRFVFPKYKTLSYLRHVGYNSVADNVHSNPLQVAVGMGVIGFLMLYGVFAWAAVRSARVVFARSSEPGRMLLGSFWAASAGYLAHLMFAPSVVGSSFLLWIAVGVVLAPTALTREVRAGGRGAAVGGLAIVLVALGIAYQAVAVAADYEYLQANALSASERSTAAAESAERLASYNYAYRTQVGLSHAYQMIDSLNAANAAQQQGQNPQMYLDAAQVQFSAAEQALRRAIHFAPADYDNYQHLAVVYNLAAQSLDPELYEDAIRTARQGIAAEPYGPAVRVELARALLATGKSSEAIQELRTAIDMDPAYGDAALLLAQALQAAGRSDEALAVLRAVEVAKPGQVGVAEAIGQLEASSTAVP